MKCCFVAILLLQTNHSSSCWMWPNRWYRYAHTHAHNPVTWCDALDMHALPATVRYEWTRMRFNGCFTYLLSYSFSILSFSVVLPPSPLSSAAPFSPELVVWMRGAGHPREKWGGSRYPQKCRGPTKGPWDIRVRERGRQREGEIGEHMKECISEGGGWDWLGSRNEGMDKERWRWEKEGVEQGETLFSFFF